MACIIAVGTSCASCWVSWVSRGVDIPTEGGTGIHHHDPVLDPENQE
jgi:hypothetical protein